MKGDTGTFLQCSLVREGRVICLVQPCEAVARHVDRHMVALVARESGAQRVHIYTCMARMYKLITYISGAPCHALTHTVFMSSCHAMNSDIAAEYCPTSTGARSPQTLMTGHTVVILADMKTTVCPVSKVDHSGLTVHAAALAQCKS